MFVFVYVASLASEATPDAHNSTMHSDYFFSWIHKIQKYDSVGSKKTREIRFVELKKVSLFHFTTSKFHVVDPDHTMHKYASHDKVEIWKSEVENRN